MAGSTGARDPAPDLIRGVFDEAPVGLAIVGPDLALSEVNAAAAELLGADPGALLGHAPWHVVSGVEPALRPRLEAALGLTADASPPIPPGEEAEVMFAAETGERLVRLSVRPLVRDGHAVAAAVMLRDATEQAAARDHLAATAAAALETSQALQALIDASPVPIVGYDLDGRVTRWSHAAERTFGWRAEEVLGSTTPTVPEERLGEYVAQLRETAEGRGLERAETRRRRKDGSQIDALVSTAALRDASGTLRGTIALIEDDTERRAAQRTLSQVIEQMPVGVVVAAAPHGRIVLRNEAAQRIWSGDRSFASTEEHAGWRGFHRDGRPYQPEEWPLARALRSGDVVADEEIEIARDDDSRTTISASAGPVRSGDGSILAAVMTFSDVGARKEAEGIRDAFLGVISHELRTPVTSIYGGARLLLRTGRKLDPNTQQAVLEDIAGESERLTRLIENTLVLARSERGGETAAREPLLLQRVLPSIVAAEAGERPDTRFEMQAAHDLPAVLGDVGYVDQVVRNLLSNAAKYGPRGATVRVMVEPAGGEVRVRVLDEGPGIGGEDTRALFRLFYRSPRTVAAAGGAGIGLFVVRHLVEAMGGRVWAGDRPEGGAEFGFALEVLGEGDPTE